MAKKRVTLQDVADRVGVSVAAVSQALSGKGRLAPETREQILKVVEELAYRPDQYAQNLARRYATQAGGKRLRRSRGRHMPPHGAMAFYDVPQLLEVVRLELRQMDEEGHDVRSCQETLHSLTRPSKRRIYRLYGDIVSSPSCPDFGYHEPDALADIQNARLDGPRAASIALTSNDLYGRIHGAWLGRVAGCVLGKPLQAGWSKTRVIEYLRLADSYPLVTYVPRVVPPPPGFDFQPEASGTFLGEIEGAPDDDDTDYTILVLHILESCGLDFQTADIATEWLGHIPYFGTYTTERAAYRNLVWNVHPDQVSTLVNPAREFDGARTRADLYGYVAPGKPELAASLAYKDAALSHTKNGIYAAMFMAAMIAWSFVTDDVEDIVRVGLSEIPRDSRLAEAVRDVLDAHQSSEDWELAYERLLLDYGDYLPIHAINNTAWVVLSLLYGGGDLDRALGTAVACGMDTGSNAANVGSVMGALASASGIPLKWIEPLQDTLFTAIARFPQARISELARRTAQLAEAVLIESGASETQV